jgi:hypothetical protein
LELPEFGSAKPTLAKTLRELPFLGLKPIYIGYPKMPMEERAKNQMVTLPVLWRVTMGGF